MKIILISCVLIPNYLMKSIIPIIRIVVENRQSNLELKGTLKLSNMIPVPDNMLKKFAISF